MHNPIGIFHIDIGNACSFLNLNIHTNEWNTTISVCASLRLIFSRRCSNVACILVKIWYVCVWDCKSCSALKKVKTGRIYTYVYVLLTLVLSNNYILKLFSSQQWRKRLVLVGLSSKTYVFEDKRTRFWSAWLIVSFYECQIEILLVEFNSFYFKVRLNYSISILRQRLLTVSSISIGSLAASGRLMMALVRMGWQYGPAHLDLHCYPLVRR